MYLCSSLLIRLICIRLNIISRSSLRVDEQTHTVSNKQRLRELFWSNVLILNELHSDCTLTLNQRISVTCQSVSARYSARMLETRRTDRNENQRNQSVGRTCTNGLHQSIDISLISRICSILSLWGSNWNDLQHLLVTTPFILTCTSFMLPRR